MTSRGSSSTPIARNAWRSARRNPHRTRSALIHDGASLAFEQQVIAELARIAEIGDTPAIKAVFGHAFLGKSLEPVGIAGGLSAEQAVAADFLGRAAIVDLVELVPAAEFACHAVPQQLEQLDPLLGLVAVGAAQILLEIGPNLGVLEVAGVRVEIDEARRHGLLDQVFDPR